MTSQRSSCRGNIANGTTQPNPLANRLRFQGPTRSDGQIRNEDPELPAAEDWATLQFGSQSIEPAVNIFNAFNTGANTQWNTGANQQLQPQLSGALQPASTAIAAALARL